MKLQLALAWLAAAPATAPAPAQPAKPAESSPRTGQAAVDALFPNYPGATEGRIPVGDAIEAHGVPMNVQSFMTNDPPRKVLDFYEAHFKKLGLPMIGNGDMVTKFPYPSVTVLDEAHDLDLSVIAVPSPDRRTMVFLALADMQPLVHDLDRAQAERFGGLAPYPKAQDPASMTFIDGEVKRVQVNFESGDSPQDVIAFYTRTFGEQGAQVIEQSENAATFRVPDGQWRVSATFHAPQVRTVVTALHTVEAPPAEERAP
ncbi:MAG: hypothetical protein JST54_21445 [Deltaproteobacteria bacterium]|nr:hypothetical protein [Deltaproteobacteria bacterium]